MSFNERVGNQIFVHRGKKRGDVELKKKNTKTKKKRQTRQSKCEFRSFVLTIVRPIPILRIETQCSM